MASLHCTVKGCQRTTPTREGTFADLNNLNFGQNEQYVKELITSLLILYDPVPKGNTDPSHILRESEDYIRNIEEEEFSEDLFQDFASSVRLIKRQTSKPYSGGPCVYMKLTPKDETISEYLRSLPLLRNGQVDGKDILVPLLEHCPMSFTIYESDVVLRDHELANKESIIQKSNELLQRIKDEYNDHIQLTKIFEENERTQQEKESWLATLLGLKTLFLQTRESEETRPAQRPRESPKKKRHG